MTSLHEDNNNAGKIGTLQQFVPRAALTLPDADAPSEPGVRAQHGCVLFADLSGFTRLVEDRVQPASEAAEDVQRLLNEAFEPVVASIIAGGGDVLNFPGDAIVAMWSATTPEDLQATVRIAEATAFELATEHATIKQSLSFRIALASGEFWLARAGGVGNRWHLLVGGKPFHQLAHLLNKVRSGELAMCQTTRQLLNGANDAPSVVADAPLSQTETSVSEQALRAYVAQSLQGRIDLDHLRWSSEFRRTSVLFARFSELEADAVSPADNQGAFRQLQDTVATTQETIRRYDGEILEFGIDDKGLVAVVAFGLVQHAHEDDAQRSLAAALELVKSISALDARVRVGIARDRLFTGTRGGKERKDLALIGNGVNLAARLSGVAEDVLCDYATYREGRGRYVFEASSSVSLKGIAESLRAFRPRGRTEASFGQDPVLGRETECHNAQNLIQEFARTGNNGCLLLEGPPGIGKSHLLDHLATYAQATRLRVLRTRCDPIESTTPYFLWRSVLQLLIDTQEGSLLAQLQQRVEPELVPWLPLLNGAIGTNLPSNELVRASSPQKRSEYTLRVLCDVVCGLCRQDRLLILVDDLQWIDSASEQLIDALHQIDNLFFVLAGRSGSDRLAALGRSSVTVKIRLGELSRDSAVQLLAEELDVDTVPSELANQVLELAGGSPLFVKQLASTIRSHADVTISGGEVVAYHRSLASLKLPSTVAGAVVSVVDELSMDEQLTLKVAAVFGREFFLDDVCGVHPQANDTEVRAHLCAAMDRDLLIQEEQTWRFRHELIRQAVYETLAIAQREELHQRIGEWIEQRNPDQQERVYTTLAHHFGQARNNDQATKYLELAALRALYEDYRAEDAIPYFERLLSLSTGTPLQRAHWHRSQADALMRVGNARDAQPQLSEALKLLGRKFPLAKPTMASKVILGLLLRAIFPPRGPRANTLPAADTEKIREMVAAYELYVRLSYGRGEPLAGLCGCLQALPLAEKLGPSYEYCNEYSMMANVIALTGRGSFAYRYESLARQSAQQITNPQALGVTHSRAVLHRLYSGDEDVEPLLDKGANVYADLGDHQEELTANYARARVQLSRGQFSDCLTLTERSLEQAQTRGSATQAAWFMLTLAELFYRMGRHDNAKQLCVEAARTSSQSQRFDPGTRFQCEGLLALIALKQERRVAVVHVNNAIRALKNGGWMSYAPQVGFMGILETQLDVDAPSDIQRQLKAMLRWMWLGARARPVLLPLRALYLAQRDFSKGRSRRGNRHLNQGIKFAQRLRLPFEEALLLAEAGRRQQGEARENTLDAAKDLFRQLGAFGELDTLEQLV